MNYDWQERVIEDVDKGESTLLQMPRRAGKSEVVRQVLRRRIEKAEYQGIEQNIAIVVPNFNQVSRYISVLSDMFRRIGIHYTDNSRMISGRNFSVHFISAHYLDVMRGLRLNLIIVDDADNVNLTIEAMNSIFYPCLEMGNSSIFITATHKEGLFKSIMESKHWNRDYEYVFPKEYIGEHVAQMLEWAMKYRSRESLVSLFKDIGLREEITLHTLNKNLKYSLTTY